MDCSLGARDGFIQPIFYKRFDRFSLQIRQNALKKNSGHWGNKSLD